MRPTKIRVKKGGHARKGMMDNAQFPLYWSYRWHCHVDFSMYNALSAGGYLTKKIGRAPIPHVACTKSLHRPRSPALR